MSSSLATTASSAVPRRGGLLGGFRSWLDAMPHPRWVCEICPQWVAAARSVHGRLGPEDFAVEALPEGALAPSPVEPNVVVPDPVRAALRAVLGRVGARGEEVALLVPDQVVRVFRLHFERLPRRAEEALPLLRWRLKKSVPFDVGETVVSYMTQPSLQPGVEVLAALARMRIVRGYEELVEAAESHAGVVLGSSVAALPLVEADFPTLVARISGQTLTTLVVRGPGVCFYRATEMSGDAGTMLPQALVDEIYPAVAYFQDTWKEGVAQVYLAGFGVRFEEFRRPVEAELGCRVAALLAAPGVAAELDDRARHLADRGLEAMVGWMWNRGA